MHLLAYFKTSSLTMKKLSLLLFVALFAVAIPPPSAKADIAVPVDFFYDALAPQGDWVYTDNYGYVWQPAVAQQPGWSPYADGYWAYTDAGWTWISNEDFGWATYHYGRWIRMFSSWFWVPGYEWAPAWVSWRQTDDYIGWAPLPPEARWSQNVGFNWWTDSYYDIGPSYYSFVPVRSFATRTSLRPFIVDRSQNVTYIDRSVNITNISYRQNVVNNIFVGGPDPARIDRFGDNRVRRLTLRRDDNDFRRDWIDNRDWNRRDGRDGRDGQGRFNSISRIENDQLIVAAPSVRRENSPGLPPRVRERFDKPEIDRGWRNIGDSNLAERLRGKQREELAKAKNEKMPEKAPVIVTGKAPPPAVGRALRPEERNLAERPDPRRVDEEVRKAQPEPGKPTQPGTPPKVSDKPPGPGERQPGVAGREGPPGRRDGEDRNPKGRPGAPLPGKVDRPSDLTTGPNGRELRPTPPGMTPKGDRDGRREGGPDDKPGQPPIRREPSLIPPGAPPSVPEDRRPGRSRESNPEGRNSPEGRRPQAPDTLNPPKSPSVPMPRPEPQARPTPMPQPDRPPQVRPAPMPRPDSPPQVRPPEPQRRPEAPRMEPRGEPRQAPPQARPTPPPSAPPPQAQPQGGGRGPGNGGPGGGGRGPGGGGGDGERRGGGRDR